MNKPTLDIKINGVVTVDVFYTDPVGRHYALFQEPYGKVRCEGGVNLNYIIEAFAQKYAIAIPDNVTCKVTHRYTGQPRMVAEKRTQPSLQAANKKVQRNKLARTWGLLVLRNTVNVIRKRK